MVASAVLLVRGISTTRDGMETQQRSRLQCRTRAWRSPLGHSLQVMFATLLLTLDLGVVFVSAQVKSLTNANTLACYACMPPFAGDQVSRSAANDIRSDKYRLFKDLSTIQTCDTFSPTGPAFQKACTTTEKDKIVVCTSITNGIWVARSCETIFADDTPKCSLNNGIRSCQCDTYLCNQSGANSIKPDSRFTAFIVGAALVSTAFANFRGLIAGIFP